jgi:5-aminopentanamidase
MNVAVIQYAPLLGNVESNIDRMRSAILSTAADVLVFPELATTGYFFTEPSQLLPLAQTMDDGRFSPLQDAVDRTRRIVVFGFAESADGALYNSALLLRPHSPPDMYRKTHLFYKERLVFSPGNTGFQVWRLDDWDCTLGIMICYDWRFPEAARSLALAGADLIVCPSNLVTNIWRLAMPVRALENKVYLAVANRTGREERDGETLLFNGDSTIIDPAGRVMVSASGTADNTVIAHIDPASTRDKSFNAINDIFADRRPDMYCTTRP